MVWLWKFEEDLEFFFLHFFYLVDHKTPTCMYSPVSIQGRFLTKSFEAYIAFIRPLTGVCAHVNFQVGPIQIGFDKEKKNVFYLLKILNSSLIFELHGSLSKIRILNH